MVVSVVSCPFLCVVVVFTQEQQKFTSISLLHCSCFAEEAVPEVEGNSSLYVFFLLHCEEMFFLDCNNIYGEKI